MIRWLKKTWVRFVCWREGHRAEYRSEAAIDLMERVEAGQVKGVELQSEVEKIINGYEIRCNPSCKKCHGRGYTAIGADGMGIPCPHARAVRVG